ncbi:MAG TPA: class I SAM-dependent methyltransferase [Terriglobia bacterium]|nr:class I SAM-dependent methyltransferase [Terriglobia bacterium]
MPKEWWEDFFSGVVLDIWKEVYDEAHTRAEADFILKVLNVPNGAALLDVPCGEGRLARELASRGHKVTGVDISPEFIQEARSRAAEKDLDIRWEQRDMRDLPWKDEFDGAFCFGGSFGYFEDEGNVDFVRSVCRSLKPGARFILDIGVSMETLLPRIQEREWTRIGDFLFLEENHYDHVHSRLNTNYTFVRDGQMETRSGSHRVYTYRELVRLLESAGLIDVQSSGSLAGDPFSPGSAQLFMVGKVKG